jgi:5-methylcytosine-specific restriction endonuclease McrA
MYEIKIDELASLCALYKLQKFSSDGAFAQAVIDVASHWDLMTRTILYGRVESTVGKHFCQFWDACEQGHCEYQKDTSAYLREMYSYAPLNISDSYPKSSRLQMRFAIFRRDNYRCQICGRTQADGVTLEVDHKQAKSKGGSDTWDNLWTLCFDCNRGKSNKTL